MGNYEQLKQSVSDVIKTNGNQEITGSILQNVLLTIISTVGANATFAGIATPATNPGTPDGPVFYLASEAGTYSNFNAIELQDGLSVLMWNGSWSSQQILSVDDVPTAGSDNLVKSGGVQEELALGAVYDVSAKNPAAGPNNDGKFESLSALLEDANLDTLIPVNVRKGGMSIKFIQSSDNNYIQCLCIADEFTTDTTKWIVSNELSRNIVEITEPLPEYLYLDINIQIIEGRTYRISNKDTENNSLNIWLFTGSTKDDTPWVRSLYKGGYMLVTAPHSSNKLRTYSTNITIEDLGEYQYDSLFVDNAFSYGDNLKNVVYQNQDLFKQAFLKVEMLEDYLNTDLVLSHVNVVETSKYAIVSQIVDGTRTELGRTAFPSLADDGVKWFKLLKNGTSTVVGRILVNTTFLMKIASIDDCFYGSGESSFVATYEKVGIKKEKVDVYASQNLDNLQDKEIRENSLYMVGAISSFPNLVVKNNYKLFLNALVRLETTENVTEKLCVNNFNKFSNREYITIRKVDDSDVLGDTIFYFNATVSELGSEITKTTYKWLYDSTHKARLLVDLYYIYQMNQIQYCGYENGSSGVVCTYANSGVKPQNIGVWVNDYYSDLQFTTDKKESLYIDTAFDTIGNQNIYKNRQLFFQAVKQVRMVNYDINTNYIISNFNMDANAANKYIYIRPVKSDGSLGGVVSRFFGSIPELASESTAKGLKWLPLYSPGKFNSLWPDSTENSKYTCGDILVDLEALYKMSQIQYCNYDNGSSGISTTFENTGIKKEHITKLNLLPTMSAALQTKAEGCINIGGYDIVRNGDITYDWKNVVDECCYTGFSKVGGAKTLKEAFLQKSYYQAAYNNNAVQVLSTRGGYIWCGYENKLLKGTLADITNMSASNVFDTISISDYTILSIDRIDWLNDDIAFIGVRARRTSDELQQCLLLKADMTQKSYKAVILMPNAYTYPDDTPSSRIAYWCYSNYNNIIVYNDYGNQGYAGRIWVSEDYGDTFRCIFKMFNNSHIPETDNDAPVNPNLPWEGRGADDSMHNGNHVHSAVYDPYYDRIWMVHGDVTRDDILDTVASAVRWSDNWRDTVPTWQSRVLDAASLNQCAIFGNKQMCDVIVMPECILLISDSGEEQGIFRINRNNRDDLSKNIDRAYLFGNRFSFYEETGQYNGICYVPGEKGWIDGVLYIPFFSHEKQTFIKPAFILATPDGFYFTKIWVEDSEHITNLGWGSRILDYGDSMIVTQSIGSDTFVVINKGKWE